MDARTMLEILRRWGLARGALLRLKPHLFAFETNCRPLLASSQIWLALGWNGDSASLAASGVPIQYVLPYEGSQIWEDDWAISMKAKHPVAAHAFLNFVLRPEIATQEARYTRYATGNAAARAQLDGALRNDPLTYPPDEVRKKLERGLPLDPESARRRADLWSELRA